MMTIPSDINWQDDFLTKQLLTYLGNKRKLLPLIHTALKKTRVDFNQSIFVDLFSGTGIVSRLAKLMGFSHIIANDWELYSYITNSVYLKEDAISIQSLFLDKGGLSQVLEILNNLDLNLFKDFYISKYYAPKNLSIFDLNKERLFYTPHNAQVIDAIRETIENWYPLDTHLSKIQTREKNTLIALLLYKVSVHTNTSGVFKAYYKDFGGYGQHNLNRILKPLMLENPYLSPAKAQKISVYKEDALLLIKNLKPYFANKTTVVYLDPPYNIHQYGSNYHLLNTIAQWDKIDMADYYHKDGTLKYKAGIRKDWKKNRSSFCSYLTATQSFKELIESITADFILVSYSIDGVIPFESMLDCLLKKGKVDIVFNNYITHRGGKKSVSRSTYNIEFILVVDCKNLAKPVKNNKKNIMLYLDVAILNIKVKTALFNKTLLDYNFLYQDGAYYSKDFKSVKIAFNAWYQLLEIIGKDDLTLQDQKKLLSQLETCLCPSKIEEMVCLSEYILLNPDYTYNILKIMVSKIKFLAYKKNKELFYKYYQQMIRDISLLEPRYKEALTKEIQNIYTIFKKRI